MKNLKKSAKKSKAETDKEIDDLVASIGIETSDVAPQKSAKSKKFIQSSGAFK